MRCPNSKITRLSSDRSGFSLLEVLVASGILVVGLASVAALLPAAASRMRQTLIQDRSGSLAANAYADVMARRSLGIFEAANLAGGRLTYFGSDLSADGISTRLDRLFTGNQNLTGIVSAPLKPMATFFSPSGADWDSHDSIEYEPNGLNLPINLFSNSTERSYKGEVCWLATVASSVVTPPSGARVFLSLAVFKKADGDVRSVTLTNIAGAGVYNAAMSDEDRRSFLAGCSYVLDAKAIPARWCKISASWTQQPSASNNTRLILDPPPTTDGLGNALVIAFEQLVRVDTHAIRLD